MAKQDMAELGFSRESDMEASGANVDERIENQDWHSLRVRLLNVKLEELFYISFWQRTSAHLDFSLVYI